MVDQYRGWDTQYIDEWCSKREEELITWYSGDWSFLMLRLCRQTLISFPASPSAPGAVGMTRAMPVGVCVLCTSLYA